MSGGHVVRIILVLLGGGLFAVIWLIFRTPSEETPCEDIPKDSVIFATAFLNLGEEGGVITPGQANVQMAEKLEECADRFSLVLTQKAVSDALVNPEVLGDGTPVLQMHDHNPNVEVRTFAALKCALERFESEPDRIVLMAHPEHHNRALMDLKALYGGEIVQLHLGDVFYEDDHWSRPLRWAWRNSLGWLVDYLLVWSIKHPTFTKLKPFLGRLDATTECPARVRLSRIVERDGKWMAKPDQP